MTSNDYAEALWVGLGKRSFAAGKQTACTIWKVRVFGAANNSGRTPGAFAYAAVGETESKARFSVSTPSPASFSLTAFHSRRDSGAGDPDAAPSHGWRIRN